MTHGEEGGCWLPVRVGAWVADPTSLAHVEVCPMLGSWSHGCNLVVVTGPRAPRLQLEAWLQV